MTGNERRLQEGLRAVAASGEQEAPARLETAVRAAFRKRARRRKVVRWALVGVGAVAASLVLGLAMRRPPEPPRPQVQFAHIGVPEIPVVAKAAAIRRRALRRAPARPRPVETEVSARFYPMPDAEMLSPLEYGTLVRVELPRSALRVIGFPINESRFAERIQADVLLGQDGLARAVRFIQ